MLQTRVGKRTAAAALHDRHRDGEGGPHHQGGGRACASSPSSSTSCCTRSSTRTPSTMCWPAACNASPGAAVGEVVLLRRRRRGRRRGGPQVRARPLGDQPRRPGRHDRRQGHPDQPRRQDLATRPLSPAAWARPCVCGAEALKIDAEKKEAVVSGTDVGHHGRRHDLAWTAPLASWCCGAVELVLPELTGDLDTILDWADEFRTLGVRANADNPEDAQLSRDFGAAGHRPVPHRAHVPGRPQADHPDLHPQRGRGRPRRRPCDAAVRGSDGRLLRHVQGHGRPAGHRAPARSAAARVPGEPARARRRDRPPRGHRRRHRASSPRSAPSWSRSTPWPRPTPCWACAAAAWASCTPILPCHAGARHRNRRRPAQEGGPGPAARDHDPAGVRGPRAGQAARASPSRPSPRLPPSRASS